jgi:16S rRNA processing protein RimM
MMPPLLYVGVIASVHGVRGQVKIKSFTAEPEAIFTYSCLTDATGKRSFQLTPRGVSGDALLATLEGVTSREAAEALKGQKLYIPRTALPELASDEEFYHEDLCGMQVVLPSGEIFGTVLHVANYGAGDLLEIATSPQDTQLFAFTFATFPQILLAERKIMMLPPETVEGDATEEQS